MSIPYSYTRHFVAAILLFSSLAKAYQTATEPSDHIEILAMGTVLFESALAFALLSGVFPRLIKWLAAVVFSLFFCIAVSLALKSVESCGCFGQVHVDPRITACLDLGVVFLLIVSRCETAKRSGRKMAIFGAGTILSLVLLIPMSLHPAVVRVEHIAGPPKQKTEVAEILPKFALLPETVELGYVESKSVHRFSLELVNNTDKDRPINNVSTDCQCIAVVESPTNVPAKSKAAVVCEFTAPEMTGPYSKMIMIESENEKFEAKMSARIDHPLVVVAGESDDSGDEFSVLNEGDEPVRLLFATVTPPVGMVKIDAKPIEPGQAKVLKIQYQTDNRNEKFSVRIQTNHRVQKQVIFEP
jgi:hypothetical protein